MAAKSCPIFDLIDNDSYRLLDYLPYTVHSLLSINRGAALAKDNQGHIIRCEIGHHTVNQYSADALTVQFTVLVCVN